jgi:hypothetical protein
MPRHRLLARIDDELVGSKESLKFWQEQHLLLAGTPLAACAKRQITLREKEADQLLDIQEHLIAMADSDAAARA